VVWHPTTADAAGHRVDAVVTPLLTPQAKADLQLGPYATTGDWKADCVECAADAVLSELGGPVWTEGEFTRLATQADGRMGQRIAEIAGRFARCVRCAPRSADRSECIRCSRFRGGVADIRAQVVRLVYPGFLAAIGPSRVAMWSAICGR
jgi:ATP-dependent helicase HrpA